MWLLLALLAIALIALLSRGCDKEEDIATTTPTTDTISNNNANTTPTVSNEDNWGDIDFNSPNANYDEITDKDISIRGNDRYGIYSLGENILFNVGESTITAGGEAKLKQIAASLGKRYKDGDIRIYGHTDSTGDAAQNKELAEQRAESVKSWMIKNADISDNRISIHPLGESQPIVSNATEEGRQQNRSVEIVARQR